MDGSGDAPTIQAGVDVASAGDTILVDAGMYTDNHAVVVDGSSVLVNVHIAKNIVLMSKYGPAVTRIGDAASTVVVYLTGVSSAAQVRGFEIGIAHYGFGCIIPFQVSASTASAVEPSGARCESSSCVIADNVFRDAYSAVYLFDSDALVTGNHVESMPFGVRCHSGSDAIVTDNLIENCGTGIFVYESSAQVIGNTIRRTAGLACSGIDAAGSGTTLLVSQNLIENITSGGIYCSGNTPTIEDNTIRKCFGIDVTNCPSLQVRRNVLVDNDHGLFAQLSTGVIVESNTCDGNGVGLNFFFVGSGVVRRNIVHGGYGGIGCDGALQIECNDVYGTSGERYGGCADQTGLNGNFSEDPQFCGIPGSGNYQLQTDSPCAPNNNPNGVACDLVGARPVGCSTVGTRSTSWGAVKALYRTK